MGNMPLEIGKLRVLVVEDDMSNRLVITRLLKLAGVNPANVHESEGNPQPFFAANPDAVDLVFLDIQLPGKDGYAILREMRADPVTKDLVIIALTANVMRQDVEKAKSSGFDGFIGKPIDGRRFSEILGKIVSGESVWTIM